MRRQTGQPDDGVDYDFIRELEAEEEEILSGPRHSASSASRTSASSRPVRPGNGQRSRSAGGDRAARQPGNRSQAGGQGNRRPPQRGKRKKTLSEKFETSFQRRKSLFFLISRAMIPAIYFYYEAIFNLTTVRDFFGMHAIFILLFSVFFGMIGSIISSIAKSRKVNMIVKAIVIFAPVIPFLIEYFVYLQFKVFYDLNTVVHGAADAAGGFKADIFRLITSAQGITHIILYILPTALFLFFELKIDKKHLLSLKTGWRRKVKMAMVTVGSYLIALLLIFSIKSYRQVYGDQYYFESAVTDFGFMTGIRKEIWRKITKADQKRGFDISGSGDADFVDDSTEENNTEKKTNGKNNGTTETASTEAKPKNYELNRYPISFSELQQKDSDSYASLDEYVASVNATKQNEYTGLFKGKNLIFISAEAFSGDIIDPQRTPTLYRLATKGINFTDYYQPASAGTTGGEFENLMGFFPTMGGQSMKQTANYNNYFTMGSQLDRLGYYGKMYHNNDYTYYSRDVTHFNLGYCDGFEGVGNGAEAYITGGWPESDLEMVEGTLPQYINKQPFNIYYMSVSGHSSYSYDANAMSRKHWSEVENLPYSEDVKAYIAANLEFEASLTYLVDQLEKAGIADDTVIVISADHFPYGLDNDAALGQMPYLSELYGYDVTNYLQRDHNRLIIWSGCLEKMDPIIVDDPVVSIDILPTLSNLFGTYWDSRLLPGRDVFSTSTPLAFNLWRDWKTDKGTYVNGEFTPTNTAEKLSDDYVDKMCSIVNNKINYCYGVLETDYFGHLYDQGVFPEIKKEYDYTKNKGMPTYTPTSSSGTGTGTGTGTGDGTGTGTGDGTGTGTGDGTGTGTGDGTGDGTGTGTDDGTGTGTDDGTGTGTDDGTGESP